MNRSKYENDLDSILLQLMAGFCLTLPVTASTTLAPNMESSEQERNMCCVLSFVLYCVLYLYLWLYDEDVGDTLKSGSIFMEIEELFSAAEVMWWTSFEFIFLCDHKVVEGMGELDFLLYLYIYLCVMLFGLIAGFHILLTDLFWPLAKKQDVKDGGCNYIWNNKLINKLWTGIWIAKHRQHIIFIKKLATITLWTLNIFPYECIKLSIK